MAVNNTESNCVVGVVLREGMVLLVHRASWLRVLPSAWGLFGGHVEKGESLEEAVRREAREELGIVPLTLRRLGQLDNPGEPGVIHVYAILIWESEPENSAPEEHAEIRWFSATELPESAALDAYRPFVAAATQIKWGSGTTGLRGGSLSDWLGSMKTASQQSDLQALFVDVVTENETIRALTERLVELGLPDAYVTAGCLCQTVWNRICGFPPAHGIIDYDIFYCDLSDLSWEGEDWAIRHCAAAFADLSADVQVRNQARVHLWYPEKFGIPHKPLRSTREGIDGFLTRCSAHGLRKAPGGGYEVYAPFGFDDVFAMVVRPNYVHNLPQEYQEKADRWQQTWPRIRVMPWEDDFGPAWHRGRA